MKIDVCICTYRRAHIRDTLLSVGAATIPDGAAVNTIVIDNDVTPSASERVAEAAKASHLPISYHHVAGANISIARNAALDRASADWIAFLDDDEVVDPDWLTNLIARQVETGADGVFGPSYANYGKDAPAWIREGDFHSQFAAPRDGIVQTGHTCNGLLRWRGTPWQSQRFDITRGKSGGEDTEFFFRLWRMGAVYAIATDAIVREDVPPARLSLHWLLSRRFRMGQSYAASAQSPMRRAQLFSLAAGKSAYCYLRTVPNLRNPVKKAFWMMRATMHAGVCAGCLGVRQPELYGG
jgi:succinoglycan biosynthesis protein ExoM